MAYKQHFVEWFSGKQLPSYWTQVGTGTPSMLDSVDGGFQYVTSSGDSFMAFNDKKQYAPDGCVMICAGRRTAGTEMRFGFRGHNTTSNNECAYVKNGTGSTNIVLRTGHASGDSDTQGSVTADTTAKAFKIECGSANIKLTINGVLDITKTTNRPTVRLQPIAGCYNGTSSYNYMEVYNT